MMPCNNFSIFAQHEYSPVMPVKPRQFEEQVNVFFDCQDMSYYVSFCSISFLLLYTQTSPNKLFEVLQRLIVIPKVSLSISSFSFYTFWEQSIDLITIIVITVTFKKC